jgi:hypothetical protein
MKHWAEMWETANLADVDIYEPSAIVDEIVVTDDRIAMTWREGGETFHAKLSSADGLQYRGNYWVESVAPQ